MNRVLIAEDEPALLDCFCELVAGLGHECVAAQDGRQALDLARKRNPDLVVTDLMMPNGNGLDIIRTLRSDPVLSRVPIVLLSAGRPSEAEQREAWRFLSKPVSLELFEQTIQEGLRISKELGAPPGFKATPNETVSPVALVREAMLTWVAHEIKSPLAAALTASQLAMRDVPPNLDRDPLKKRLGIIARQLVRMDELVTSILDAAQLQEGKLELDLEDFDVGPWVAQIAEFWKELHPDYRFPVADGYHLLVNADRERLRQVLDNLISNAIKYGGPSKIVSIAIEANEHNVCISVTDDGKGIAPEDLPHIFDRFHRVAGQGGRGHGLGLYIAAALARLHGGELTVESSVGNGATFTLAIPRKLDAAPRSERGAPPSSS